jgi:hypothetical protein
VSQKQSGRDSAREKERRRKKEKGKSQCGLFYFTAKSIIK